MNKKINYLFFSICFLMVCIFGCKKNKDTLYVDFDYSEPSVTLDAEGEPDSLYISFDASVAKIEDVEKEPSTPISIKPEIPGKWIWESDSTLIFKPTENWKLDTSYTITFPNEIFSDIVEVDNSFSFKTEQFEAWISNPEFYINPENPNEKKVTCTIASDFPILKESLKNAVSMKLNYQDAKGNISKKADCNYNVSWNKSGTQAYIVSDNIPIPPFTSFVEIELNNKIECAFGGKSDISSNITVEIPGMSDFVSIREISTNLVKNNEQNYDQILVIETKGAISVEEIAKKIEVYELPKDRPAMEGWEEDIDAYWNSSYVTKDILKLSKRIQLEAIPTEEPATSINSFKYNATPGRYLYIKINGTLNFFGGYKLSFSNNNCYETTLTVPKYPKELSILSEGTILSLSGNKKMALSSRGVKNVYYKVSRIMPKDVNHLISQSNGDMKNFRFDDVYSFNEDNISESEYSEYTIPDYSDSEISYFSYDFSNKLYQNNLKNLKNGLFLFYVCDNENNLYSSYPSGLYDKRLILVTDLGFFIKHNSNGTKDVFVQSISTGNPVPYAEVSIIGLNGNPLLTTITDSTGHVNLSLPSTQNRNYYTGEHKPIAYVVKTSNDLSFMPYSTTGRTLDYSNFDVGGLYETADPQKITAFMFSDRGQYRPGDKANFGIIAKSGDWNIDLAGSPLEAEIIDPNGSVVFNKKIRLSSSGFEEFSFDTQDYSPTGVYTANLYLLKEYKDWTDREFLTHQTIKVEEFLPDTLSLSVGFNPLPENGWINPGQLEGTISLKNLFGTPASGNTVKAQITLNPGFPVLYKYSDYYFTDPYFNGKTFEEFLGSQETNENGETSFNIDLNKFEKATYNLSLYVEAFEKGSGRNVTQESSIYVSPLKYLIGYKADGSLSYINAKSKRKLTLIAIDQKLNQIDLNDVTMQIEDIKYVSTLVKQNNGLYKYQSVKKSYPVSSEKISISKNGTEIFLPSETPGEYKVTLTNKEGLVFNTINYTIVGDQNTSRSLTRTAELDIKLESSDLSAGSTAKIFIKAPYKGAGLITIERDKVYTYKWFKTDELSSIQTINIPTNLEGNGYVNVMFTRATDSDEIFMSPFCYGAVPFSIDKENRTNKIKLEVPQEIKSGTDLTINYSSEHSGKIILYAVDEGILQVAKYKLPNPLAHFFKKRALEVGTSQILDLVLPEYKILQTLGATGGGAGMDMLSKNLNPFKRKQNAPVVYWSGIIETGPEKRSVTYKVPDYFNGSLRVMAVSVSKDRIGTANVSTLARNTFIIMPNIPLAAAPGDEFDVSVTVTNNRKGSGPKNNVELKIEPTSNLEIVGDSTIKMTIPEGKDSTVTIRVRAKDSLGNADLKFIAKDSADQSVLTSSLSIRPSMPYQVRIKSGSTKKDKAELDVNYNQYSEFEERSVATSNVPTSFIDGLSFFLEKYPYGCSEQITSKAYPYLYEDFVKAGNKTRSDAEKMVSNTVGIIQSRMKSDGNIGYWTSKSPQDSAITLYCADFLTDAQKKDFYVPSSMFTKVLSAVKSIANSYEDDSYSIYLRSYAIYILTKNEIITTNYIESLEDDITRKNYTPTDYEGLYLAASYKMMQQNKKAQNIMSKIKNKKTFDSSWFYHNNLHYISTYIQLISTYFPERIGEIKSKDVDLLCEYLTNAYYNTYSTAAAIRAFESYANQDKSETYKAFETIGKEQTELELSGTSVLKGNFSSKAEKIIFTNESKMPMYYQAIISGFEKTIPTSNIKDGLEVTREYIKDKSDDKSKDFKVGDTITVKISFRSTGGTLNNIALVDLSPAGFETDIESIREDSNNSWEPDYVDIREDRVVIYGTVTDEVKTFTYKTKAINSGTFIVPPMFAESMYNKDIRALSVYKPIVIKPVQ